MVDEVVRACPTCGRWKLPKPRPMIRASFARFFNRICQADGFVLQGEHFVMIIDECMKYKQAEVLEDHTYATLAPACGS